MDRTGKCDTSAKSVSVPVNGSKAVFRPLIRIKKMDQLP